MSFSERIVQIKITSGTMIDGVMVKAGQVVEMVESEAKNLMRLGKAKLHAIEERIDGKPDNSDAQQAAAAAAAAATPAKVAAKAK